MFLKCLDIAKNASFFLLLVENRFTTLQTNTRVGSKPDPVLGEPELLERFFGGLQGVLNQQSHKKYMFSFELIKHEFFTGSYSVCTVKGSFLKSGDSILVHLVYL